MLNMCCRQMFLRCGFLTHDIYIYISLKSEFPGALIHQFVLKTNHNKLLGALSVGHVVAFLIIFFTLVRYYEAMDGI